MVGVNEFPTHDRDRTRSKEGRVSKSRMYVQSICMIVHVVDQTQFEHTVFLPCCDRSVKGTMQDTK